MPTRRGVRVLVATDGSRCGHEAVGFAIAAALATGRGLDIVNLAVATNARGGPGIVLASVAFDAGIVNAAGYTTLVLVAVLTSQAAGAWLEHVTRKGWPLLEANPATGAPPQNEHASKVVA